MDRDKADVPIILCERSGPHPRRPTNLADGKARRACRCATAAYGFDRLEHRFQFTTTVRSHLHSVAHRQPCSTWAARASNPCGDSSRKSDACARR
jgi:hypothetical protein